LSSWLLELSDRFILEKFVPLAQIGIYSLGYQFGSIVNMAASALNAAWTPYVFRITDQDPENSKIRVARLATYYVLVLAVVFLIIGLFVRDVNHIATEQSYHEAYLVTYWIVVAQLMQGLYYLPVTVLFLIKKTKYIPIVTLASAVVDITLNLVLLPRFGMLAAAWAGFASKVVMVLIVSLIANRLYPIPYEYGRLFKLLLGVIMLFVAGLFVPFTSLWLSLGAKVVLFLLLPAVLALLKFYTSDERDRLRLALHRITFIRVADKLV
ncbi:MAG: hypothetical protein FJZ98_10280, partial [Chloroflexi bacterium]|nr:hypothetical protein [Chloroflexota bacterium]